MPRSVLEYFSASQPPKALKTLTNDLWNIIESNFQTVSLIGCNLTFCYKQNIKSLKPNTSPTKQENRSKMRSFRKKKKTWITLLENYIPLHCSEMLEWGTWTKSLRCLCCESPQQSLLGILQAALRMSKTFQNTIPYRASSEWNSQ